MDLFCACTAMHVKNKIAVKALLKYFIPEDNIFCLLAINSKANANYSAQIASSHE
jgi:hypothetical protein